MLSEYKWRFLVLSIFVVFPIYYVYFFPIIFKKKLEFEFYDHFQHNFQNFETFYSLLFALCTLPNIFLPLFKVKILRNGKLKLKLLIFFLFIFVGELVFEEGYSQKNVYLMLLGRFLFGVGAEIIFSLINAFLMKYFNFHALKIIMASLFTISTTFGAFSFIISPIVLIYYDVFAILSINKTFLTISLVFLVMTILYDKYIHHSNMKINTLLESIDKNTNIYQENIKFSQFFYSAAKRNNKINFLLYIFPIFSFMSSLLFNNYGANFLNETTYKDVSRNKIYMLIGVQFCGYWLFSVFFATLVTFYLEYSSEEKEKIHSLTVTSFFILIAGHLINLFFYPLVGIILIGISYGISFPIVFFINEAHNQNEDFLISGINLGLTIGSLLIGLIEGKNNVMICEIFCLFLAIMSFLIYIFFNHNQILKFQKKKTPLEEYTIFSTLNSERNSLVELDIIKKKF